MKLVRLLPNYWKIVHGLAVKTEQSYDIYKMGIDAIGLFIYYLEFYKESKMNYIKLKVYLLNIWGITFVNDIGSVLFHLKIQ